MRTGQDHPAQSASHLILIPNRNLGFFPARIVPCFVEALDHICPLCSAGFASPDTILSRKSFPTFLSDISINLRRASSGSVGKKHWACCKMRSPVIANQYSAEQSSALRSGNDGAFCSTPNAAVACIACPRGDAAAQPGDLFCRHEKASITRNRSPQRFSTCSSARWTSSGPSFSAASARRRISL